MATMVKPLRWGILSTARINRRLIPALLTAERSELAAVAGRDPDRTRGFAAEWEVPETRDSYRELLSDDGIDAVYIPLPNSLHLEWTLAALAAGKHVLCEKPLGLEPAEVVKLEKAARKAGRVLMEAMAYRMHPQYLALKRLVESGALGRLALIRASFSFTLAENSGNIRLDPTLGGGSLYDIGCYPVSLACGLDPTPAEAVSACARTGGTGVDCLFCGQVRFASGTVLQFDSAFSLPYRVGAEVAGEKGRIIVPNPWQPDLDGKPSGLIRVLPDDHEELIETEKVDPYLCEIRAMEAAVLDGKPPAYPLRESRRVIAILAALRQAALGAGD